MYALCPLNIAYFCRLSDPLPPGTRYGEPKPRYLQSLDRTLQTTTTEQDSSCRSIRFSYLQLLAGSVW